jgi:hypothetical protein
MQVGLMGIWRRGAKKSGLTPGTKAISVENRHASDAPERIAVISDVHSEPEVLQSVLDAIDTPARTYAQACTLRHAAYDPALA